MRDHIGGQLEIRKEADEVKNTWRSVLRMGHLLAETFFGTLGLLYILFDIRSSFAMASCFFQP